MTDIESRLARLKEARNEYFIDFFCCGGNDDDICRNGHFKSHTMDCDQYPGVSPMKWLIETIEELMRQNAIAREAIEFYGSVNNWAEDNPNETVYDDCGKRARQAKAEMNRGDAK